MTVEYVRSIEIKVNIDTNSRTIKESFDNYQDAIDYLEEMRDKDWE